MGGGYWTSGHFEAYSKARGRKVFTPEPFPEIITIRRFSWLRDWTKCWTRKMC